MNVHSNTSLFILVLLFFFYSNYTLSQGSVTATYNAGDIPTGYNGGNWDPACNGSSTVLSVTLPPGLEFEVLGVDVSYDMVSAGNLWMSGQNSQVHFQNTNTSESTVSEGSGDMTGTEMYSRTNLSFANGNYSGGMTLNFEIRAWRDYPTGTPGCTTETGKVANGTWTITVYYCPEIVPPRVGINTSDPKATLDVGGEIIIGDDGNPAEPGMIKWETTGSACICISSN